MLELGNINHDFPSIGQFHMPTPAQSDMNRFHTSNVTRSIVGICGATRDGGAICDCPKRDTISERPSSLPFKYDPTNNKKMRNWLLRRYSSSSTLITCPHQDLPEMVEIHVKEGAQPVACHKPATIPIHWQDQVRNDLERDEALGLIEHVPIGEPLEWCHAYGCHTQARWLTSSYRRLVTQ